VLQYVAVGCKCVAIFFCEWKGAFSGADFWADVSGVVLCCSVLQCVAVGCIGLQYVHGKVPFLALTSVQTYQVLQ